MHKDATVSTLWIVLCGLIGIMLLMLAIIIFRWWTVWPNVIVDLIAMGFGAVLAFPFIRERSLYWDVYAWDWSDGRVYTPESYRMVWIGGPIGILVVNIADVFWKSDVTGAIFASLSGTFVILYFGWMLIDCIRHLTYQRSKEE